MIERGELMAGQYMHQIVDGHGRVVVKYVFLYEEVAHQFAEVGQRRGEIPYDWAIRTVDRTKHPELEDWVAHPLI